MPMRGTPRHKDTHESGGSDEIDVTGLHGVLADGQPIAAHAATHQNGGVDEVDVVGLSGLLADDQHVLDAEVLLVAAALVHAARHENGGADEISVAGLSGLLADDQHVLDAEVLLVAAALVHAARHQNGGADEISVAGLSGLLADDQHVLDAEVLLVAAALVHAARHKDGGADELDVSELAGAIGGAGEIPETDGAAVSWVDPDGRYDPKAHALSHQSGGADEIKDIELNNAPVYNDTGSGILVVARAGENVTAGEILYMKADGKYWKADADAVGTMPAKVMAMEAISPGGLGKLLHMGYFRHDAWTWVRGDGEANLLFASVTPGAMSVDQPVGAGDQVQVVGYVVTADIVFFNPSYELVEVA